jgi:hypothetical protein
MANNGNLLKLAKGTSEKKATPAKKATKVVEKKLTPEEQRNLKAKETVKNLLDGVDLEITTKKEELLEVEEEPKSGDIWLQEQVALLASENEILKTELMVAKNDFQKLLAENQALKNGGGAQNDGNIKAGVLTLFHEIQSNYIKMGFDPLTHNPNLIIPPAAFMNRMILFFPFLQQEKRF